MEISLGFSLLTYCLVGGIVACLLMMSAKVIAAAKKALSVHGFDEGFAYELLAFVGIIFWPVAIVGEAWRFVRWMIGR